MQLHVHVHVIDMHLTCIHVHKYTSKNDAKYMICTLTAQHLTRYTAPRARDTRSGQGYSASKHRCRKLRMLICRTSLNHMNGVHVGQSLVGAKYVERGDVCGGGEGGGRWRK